MGSKEILEEMNFFNYSEEALGDGWAADCLESEIVAYGDARVKEALERMVLVPLNDWVGQYSEYFKIELKATTI